MKITPWKAGLLLALIGISIALVDYIGSLLLGPMSWYKFSFFLLGLGLIYYTIGWGVATGYNSEESREE